MVLWLPDQKHNWFKPPKSMPRYFRAWWYEMAFHIKCTLNSMNLVTLGMKLWFSVSATFPYTRKVFLYAETRFFYKAWKPERYLVYHATLKARLFCFFWGSDLHEYFVFQEVRPSCLYGLRIRALQRFNTNTSMLLIPELYHMKLKWWRLLVKAPRSIITAA